MSFEDLASRCSIVGLRDYYQLIYEREKERPTQDAATPIRHTASDLRFLRDVLYNEVQRAHTHDGFDMQSLAQVREDEANRSRRSIISRALSLKRNPAGGAMVYDGFFNPQTGYGTELDPNMWAKAYTPISISPQEGAALYSSGGIAQIIIDKKAKGVLLNGFQFKGRGWKEDELNQMKDHAESTRMSFAASAAFRDGLTFGGAILYPHLKDDTPLSFSQSIKQLIEAGILKKGSIDRWVETDRWNCVFVPHWDVTAEDYLTPRSYYIPLGGLKLATERSAIIRPKPLPFWAAILQIGWSTSDMVGWIRPMYGYETMIDALPTLFQQMSLLFEHVPLDGVLTQGGMDQVDQLIRDLEKRSTKWSALRPSILGIAGELQVVERHYENMDELFMIKRQDIGAKSGIPESVIWPSQPKGLADSREEDVQLKQSETVKRMQIETAPAFQGICQIVAVSTFGPTKEVLDRLDTLEIEFDAPAMQSPEQRAEALQNFSDGVSKLVAAQCPLDVAVDIALEFMSDIHLPARIMNRLQQDLGEAAAEAEGYEPLQALETVIGKLKAAAGEAALPGVRKLENMADEVRKTTHPGLKLLENSAARARRAVS